MRPAAEAPRPCERRLPPPTPPAALLIIAAADEPGSPTCSSPQSRPWRLEYADMSLEAISCRRSCPLGSWRRARRRPAARLGKQQQQRRQKTNTHINSSPTSCVCLIVAAAVWVMLGRVCGRLKLATAAALAARLVHARSRREAVGMHVHAHTRVHV